jgi:hypothetical protein
MYLFSLEVNKWISCRIKEQKYNINKEYQLEIIQANVSVT